VTALLRSLRAAWMPAAVADIGATAALLRVAGFSMRQGALGIAIAAALAALAWRQHAWEWLGLYCMLLAPLAAVGAAAQGLRLLPRLGWPAVWAIVLALIAASAMVGVELNRALAAQHAVRGLRDAPAFACAAGFGLLVLALPLWQLQTQAAGARLAALEQAALSAELKALQAQIEPHFLYNTLANTRYLVRHDADKAGTMLDHLIAYLHSALPDMRGSGSTLGREFELAGHYLALMAIRFGERLSYRLDCAPALACAAMPPLMLMSLVENAVRHGVETTPGPVCVTLSAAVANGALCVLVTDEGAGAAAPVLGSGVGLRNLRARLAAQYGDAATFTLRIAPGQPTQAQLILPLEPS